MHRLLSILAILCWLCCQAFAQEAPPYRVGVTAFRDKSATIKEWQPTMDFLATQVPGARFEVVPLNLSEFEVELSKRSLDFLITNPLHYIAFEFKYGVSRVATLVRAEGGQVVNQFGGVVFVRADRHDLADLPTLKGRRIAATDPTSFAAYLIQFDLLKEHGIDPGKDAQLTFMGFPQDLNVQAVLEGHADAGFVRSGLLESMAREGKLDLHQIRVLHREHANDFPFLVSSDLYPEWPFGAAPHVSIDVRNRVTAALLLMQPNAPAARVGRYYRWSTPVEYLSVQRLMQRLRIYPFDADTAFSLDEVVRRYAPQLALAALGVALVVGVLYLRSRRLNGALLESRQELRKLAQHDALTGLPNRNLLDDRLERLILQAQRNHAPVAVCMLDLDGFKPINDRLGHAMGDRVLTTIAQRIAQVVRAADTVARFGGDEFVILASEVEADAALAHLLGRIIAAVAEPIDCGEPVQVHASIGVSLFGQDAQDATTLMRHADEAMYRAKAAGGNRYVVYGA